MTKRDPDLVLSGFCLWVTGKPYADVEDDYGQDLLSFETTMYTPSSTLRGSGTLSAARLADFNRDLTYIVDTLDGEAILEADQGETVLVLTLAMRPLGHVEAVLGLRIGYDEDHRIAWSLDQTYLSPLAHQVRTLAAAYPSPYPASILQPVKAVEPQTSGLTTRLLNAIFGARTGPI